MPKDKSEKKEKKEKKAAPVEDDVEMEDVDSAKVRLSRTHSHF